MEHFYHTLQIKDIRRETETAVTLVLDIPDDLREAFSYKAGQYVMMKMPGEEERAFSISSSPVEDSFYFTIKHAEDKSMEQFVSGLEPGKELTVSRPEGKYTIALSEEEERFFYFFAAGSGITPLMSIVKTILELEPKSTVHLFYGNRNHDSVIFKDQLETLEQRYTGQLIVEYIFSRQESKGGFLKNLFSRSSAEGKESRGRIDRKSADRLLKKYPCFAPGAEYFICGPGEMISALMNYLLEQNISKEHIHVEHFKAHEDHSDEQYITPDQAKLIAHLDGERIELPIDNKPVLEILQDAGYDPPFSCQSGACSTCVAKILQGSAEMEMCYALDEDEIAEGYILTCQAHATSPVLEVTYDN